MKWFILVAIFFNQINILATPSRKKIIKKINKINVSTKKNLETLSNILKLVSNSKNEKKNTIEHLIVTKIASFFYTDKKFKPKFLKEILTNNEVEEEYIDSIINLVESYKLIQNFKEKRLDFEQLQSKLNFIKQNDVSFYEEKVKPLIESIITQYGGRLFFNYLSHNRKRFKDTVKETKNAIEVYYEFYMEFAINNSFNNFIDLIESVITHGNKKVALTSNPKKIKPSMVSDQEKINKALTLFIDDHKNQYNKDYRYKNSLFENMSIKSAQPLPLLPDMNQSDINSHSNDLTQDNYRLNKSKKDNIDEDNVSLSIFDSVYSDNFSLGKRKSCDSAYSSNDNLHLNQEYEETTELEVKNRKRNEYVELFPAEDYNQSDYEIEKK